MISRLREDTKAYFAGRGLPEGVYVSPVVESWRRKGMVRWHEWRRGRRVRGVLRLVRI